MFVSWLIERLDPSERNAFGRRVSMAGIACNVLLVIAKGTAGLAAGSISMVADAVNNLMDATSSVVSLIGFRMANKPADSGHPYGHGRYEYLAGLCVATIVVLAGIELVRASVGRILSPTATQYSWAALAVLVASVAAKLLLSRINQAAAERIGSTALHAAAIDSRNDALATCAVLCGALVSRFAHVQVDGALGALVGLFVTASGVGLLRDTINPLLGDRPDPRLVERVRRRILSYPEVLGTHDLLVHDYGPESKFASAHVEMAAERDPMQTHEIIDRIERDVRDNEGLALILHYDPIVTTPGPRHDPRAQLADAIRRVDERLTIHDLVIEGDEREPTFVFDCVCPRSLGLDEDVLTEAITHEVHRFAPDATCRITYDEGFVSPMR